MAFCWKVCGNMKVLFGLLLLLFILTETKQSCNYYQNLEVGRTYYAFNPEYPNEFKGEANCIWQITSPYDVKINCTINISNKIINTGRCEQSLTIQFDKKETKSVCKNDTFIIEGMNPIIIFNSTKKSQGIKFLCKIKVEKVLDKNCSCGKKKTTRIVGGNETGVNEYPMMAGIVSLQNREIYCGATIICQTYVVTAAHCVENKTPKEIGVVVGEHDVSTGAETNATNVFHVTKIDIADAGDIALCKIEDVIKYSAEVGPVCLPFQHSCDSFGGAIVTALGWGLLEYAGRKPDSLQEVKLNVISLKECEEVYFNNDYNVSITSKNICTYTPGKDTCQMDSGGPVLWKDPTTKRLVLIGITISGVACAIKEPAVDTRVGYFINWIKSHTDGCQFCGIE